MRRPLLLGLLCLAALGFGCGGDDSSGGPFESSLAYVPKDAPFLMAVETDLEGGQYRSLQEILDSFPGGLDLEGLLEEELEGGGEGISFEKDVEPLLGNPFVVSATDVTSFLDDSEDDGFVAAIEVEDREALDRVIEKTKPDEQGEVAGATVYADDGSAFAVDDDMVVFAGSRRQLEAALERADGGDHLEASAVDAALEGLPGSALARVYLDVQALIAQDADAETVRKVDWIAGLRTLGMTASLEDDAVDVDFNLRSDGEGVGEEEVPLAGGDEPPAVAVEPGEVGFGLRDPSHVIGFFEDVLQSLSPGDFGDYEAAKQLISQQLGIDVDRDLVGQLTGDLSVSVAVNGTFGARSEVEDPRAFSRTIDTIADKLPDLGAGLGISEVRRAGEIYEAQLNDGGSFAFGVLNDVFVVASTPARAVRLSTQEPSPVEGAEGSLAMTADAERVAEEVVKLLGSELGLAGMLGAGLFTRPLDELTGSVTSSPESMRGSFSLTLD